MVKGNKWKEKERSAQILSSCCECYCKGFIYANGGEERAKTSPGQWPFICLSLHPTKPVSPSSRPGRAATCGPLIGNRRALWNAMGGWLQEIRVCVSWNFRVTEGSPSCPQKTHTTEPLYSISFRWLGSREKHHHSCNSLCLYLCPPPSLTTGSCIFEWYDK